MLCLLRREGASLVALVLAILSTTLAGQASADVGEGLIAYWNFDECGGSIVYDQSGYGNHGSISQATWFPCGPWGGGCALEIVREGIVNYIPSSFDDPITMAFTIACWMVWYGPSDFPPGVERWSYVFDARTSSSGFILAIQRDGNPVCLLVRSGGEFQSIYGTTTVAEGMAAHVALVFDATSETLRLYVQGVETDVASAPYPYYGSYLSAAIGNNHWAPGNLQWAPFNGLLDELRIYNRALSAEEIVAVMQDPGAQPSRTEEKTWGAIKEMCR